MTNACSLLVAIGLVTSTVACGPQQDGRGTTSPTSFDCAERRELVHGAVAHSQRRACQADLDCVTVTGPRSFETDFRVVVHRFDAESVIAQSAIVIEECGASAHSDPRAGFTNIEGKCTRYGCTGETTSLRPYDDN